MQPKDRRLVTEHNLETYTEEVITPVNSRLDSTNSRVESIEAMAGLAPGDVTDAQTANLITQPASNTRSALQSVTTQIIQETVPPVPDGVVTSQHQLNIVLTGDPNYHGQEGDIVFLYEQWRDFTLLDSLDKVTPQWESTTRWSDANGVISHAAGTSVRTVQSVNMFDGQPEQRDVEIVARVRSLAHSSNASPGILIRGSGTSGDDATGIMVTIGGNKIRLVHFTDGTYGQLHDPSDEISVAPEEWVWLRVRAIGNEVSARAWLDGDTEPTEWLYNITLGSEALQQPGWVGLVAASNRDVEFSAFGAAVGGTTAPKEVI